MTFKSNLAELRGVLQHAPRQHVSSIETTIDLYGAKKARIYKTALVLVVALAFPTLYNQA